MSSMNALSMTRKEGNSAKLKQQQEVPASQGSTGGHPEG